MDESWIDEEGLSEPAYVFLRDLVKVYQTRQEPLWFINTASGFIDHSGLDSSIKLEIKNWVLRIAAIELSDENKKLKQQLREAQHTPLAPKVLKDEERFKRFEEDLLNLCKKHEVSIDADYDGVITVVHREYKEDSELNLYISNGLEITEKEKTKRDREVNDSVFYNR
jgi:hypothetical protein